MQRMSELEGARGLLAIWVVLVHLISAVGFDTGSLGILKPLFSDHIRVKIFCAMSGLVIFILLDRTNDNYVSYIIKRFFRLFPAYLIVLMISVLLIDVYIAALQTNPFGGKFNQFRLEIARQSSANAFEHILAHITMLHSIVPESLLPLSSYAFVGQAWNLTYEWIFYLCAPFLFFLASKNRNGAIGAALLYIFSHFLTRSFVNLPTAAQYVSWFMIGFLSYQLWMIFKHTGIRHASLWICASASSLYMLTGELAAALWAVMFASILGSLQANQNANLVCRFLKSQPLLFFGKISYSIYLLHMIPLYLGMYVLNMGSHSHLEYIVLLGSWTILATTGASMLLFKYVEQPAIHFGKAISESRRLNKLMQIRLVKPVS